MNVDRVRGASSGEDALREALGQFIVQHGANAGANNHVGVGAIIGGFFVGRFEGADQLEVVRGVVNEKLLHDAMRDGQSMVC